jgi:hypothetical protein
MYLKEIVCDGVVQDRVQWRVLMDIVTHIRVAVGREILLKCVLNGL